MRMVLEVVMLFTLVGGLFFVMNVLAKENKQEKAEAQPPKVVEPESED
ncbi:hypothetical protein KEF85_04040 [Methylomonas paludis]|uniref:Uncharacterized protein n=1 Tax=Methylomonas paludis TaxID=1173101 RepID=A0A975RAS8_9GAMM|nr:hypothetical protein [Methylomonas paludis]QWF71658.1 hypothetical protein KEF85_04040 [Methylomonas paludis]